MLISLLSVFTAAVFIPSGSLAFVCPKDGFYANDADCGNTYWVCTAGRLFFMHCPTNLRFDENRMKCLYPYEVPICPTGDSWKPFQPTTEPTMDFTTESATELEPELEEPEEPEEPNEQEEPEELKEPDEPEEPENTSVTETTPIEETTFMETMTDPTTEPLLETTTIKQTTKGTEEEVTTIKTTTEQLPETTTIWQTTEEPEKETVCFPDLGCFSRNEFPDLPLLPMDPASISVTFNISQTKDLKQAFTFGYNVSKEEMDKLPFDPMKPTKFIIHGWGSGTLRGDNMNWIKSMRHVIEQKYKKYREINGEKIEWKDRSVNVIIVDWSRGAQNVAFETAVVNTKLVAAEMAHLIANLIKWRHVNPRDVHLIGNQIGAHLAGFVGEKFDGDNKLGQITGLDPISRRFFSGRGSLDSTNTSSPKYFSASNGLDSSDAHLVNVIHLNIPTNGPKEWTGEGHYDFYPNAGNPLGHCAMVKGLKVKKHCDYVRAVDMVQTDFRPPVDGHEVCQPVAYKCESHQRFAEGKCADCGKNQTDCQLMPNYFDHWDNKLDNNSVEGKFYLETAGKESICLYHYQLVIHLTNGWPTDHKNISLIIQGKDQKIVTLALKHPSKAGQKTLRSNHFFVSDEPIYPLKSIEVLWKGWFTSWNYQIKNIQLNYMSNIDSKIRDTFSSKLCPKSKKLFTPCVVPVPVPKGDGAHWPFFPHGLRP